MKVSETFYSKTDMRFVYNIMAIQNIPSVIEHGILCYDLASRIPHVSIALNDVQLRRNEVQIPNGMKLHQYANLYFTFHNPMLYSKQDQADELCILAVTHEVLDLKGCVLTDRNAAASLVKFYTPEEGVAHINFDQVYAKNWNHPDVFETRNHKAIKCAEILVPFKVPYDKILYACVVSINAKEELLNTGFDREIIIKPSVFYRYGGE